jgi:isopentenyldiphosphate isomerase
MLEGPFPKVTAVNEKDEVIGYFDLFEAIDQGLMRRIVAVFVFDESGRVLIQRRSAYVLDPNLLEYSVAGHVKEGDTYLESAAAELSEELGISSTDLILLKPSFMTPGFYNGIYKTVVYKDIVITPNPDEVDKVFWVLPAELESMIQLHPQQFTGPFLAVWPHVRDKIII